MGLPPKRAGNRGKGRPKGVPNRVTSAFKEALLAAFHELGGVDALVEWATPDKNRGQFYQICGRLIPHEVTGPDGGPIAVDVHHHHG